jgi:D-alanyl-D-alanine carboxypeptidase
LSDASVTALSGYAERSDGEVLIFSILVNGHSGGSAAAMDAVDLLAEVLLDAPLRLSQGNVVRGAGIAK